MKFEIDKQTISDLELFEKSKGTTSVFNLFSHTKSLGGSQKLERMFNSPLTDISILQQRIDTIRYFEQNPVFIDIEKEWLDFAEYYLALGNKPTRYSVIDIIRKAIRSKIKHSNESYLRHHGVQYITRILQGLHAYFCNISDCPEQVDHYKSFVLQCMESKNLQFISKLKNPKRLGMLTRGRLDYYYRYLETDKITRLFDIIYEIDAFKAIAETKQGRQFCYPSYAKEKNHLEIRGLYHPFLKEPVVNDTDLNNEQNIYFLTGPNMAGKSTYMKSLGTAVYLAHIGFPVPAKSMCVSIFNGLLTTINLSDNLNKGFSHYYNEVLRVKYVAEQIAKHENIVVIFDELFRGTNIKDAYEASLSVINSLAKLHMSVFVISTHIVEVADQLKQHDSIQFKYFEIGMNNGEPEYTYTLKDGITNERIGMYILNKEKVVETIENAIKNTQSST